jgi:hypothetical protein
MLKHVVEPMVFPALFSHPVDFGDIVVESSDGFEGSDDFVDLVGEIPKSPRRFDLPFDVMERISDLASPMTVLNLQLANSEWAAACRGKLQKHADTPVEDLLRDARDEALELIGKHEWERKFGDYMHLSMHLKCFETALLVTIKQEDVYEFGMSEVRARKNLRMAWNNEKRNIDAGIMCALAFSMANVRAKDGIEARTLRQLRLFDADYVEANRLRIFSKLKSTYIIVRFFTNRSPNSIWEQYFDDNREDIEKTFNRGQHEKTTSVLEREFNKMKLKF